MNLRYFTIETGDLGACRRIAYETGQPYACVLGFWMFTVEVHVDGLAVGDSEEVRSRAAYIKRSSMESAASRELGIGEEEAASLIDSFIENDLLINTDGGMFAPAIQHYVSLAGVFAEKKSTPIGSGGNRPRTRAL